MTKAQYFEMCEALGSEPVEEQIPVEFEDLPFELQRAMLLWDSLADNIDGMNGIYHGKFMQGLPDILLVNNIEKIEWKETFELVRLVDRVRVQIYAERRKPTEPPKKPLV